MKNAPIIIALILLIALTLGCVNQSKDVQVNSATANTQLKLNSTSVTQGEFCTLTCQLNMTRGTGLNNKTIVWFLDNSYLGKSRTLWGYATYNLTGVETRQLSLGVHIINATFEGDVDYVGSKATSTLQVQVTAPTLTPSESPIEPNNAVISLNIPPGTKFGCKDVSGTHSGVAKDKNIYVLIKPDKAENWRVQQYPLMFFNGTYTCRICFDKPSDKSELTFEIIAIVTNEKLSPNTEIKDLPKTDAESRTTITVKG